MRKTTRKEITPHLIYDLRILLSKIKRVRGAPKQLKQFINRILKYLDYLMNDSKAQNRLITVNLLIEIIVKLIQLLK